MISLSFEHVAIFLFICWAIWFNSMCNTAWIHVGPVKQHKYKAHPSKGAYGGSKAVDDRMYIILGGSGFVGSWIARYLLARGEKHVFILDRDRPAKDLLVHGVSFVEVDLTNLSTLEREFNKLNDLIQSTTKVAVYNCAIIKKLELPNFRADLGVNVAEMLLVALRLFTQGEIILIHVGDTLAHRLPVRNWDRVWPTSEIWCQEAASDLDVGFGPAAQSKEDRRDRSFSSYAWHQLQVETMILQASIENPSIAGSAVLRIEGFTSGHLGDGFLSPVIKSGGLFLHSPNVPISIVNVEDVARGCLSLEHLLMDPSTRENVNSRIFTVGSKEITTLGRVFEYCKLRRKNLRVYPIPPALTFIATWLLGFIYTGKPVARRGLDETLLKFSLRSLTFARFYTLQVGQVPNPSNEKRQHDVLALHNNFTLAQTLEELIKEIELTEKKKV